MVCKALLQGILFICFFVIFNFAEAQFTQVGTGGYTNNFPGVDAANRNSFPSGSPQLSGAAVGKPVPTNDWWSLLIKNDHVSNLFNYPMAMKTTPAGLVVSYIPWGVFDDQEPIVVGLTGLNAVRATVSDYSDWTVTMNWNDGVRNFQATSGVAMPFIYFEKQSSEAVQIKINLGTVTVNNEILVVENARNGADFVVYAPEGSTWSVSGTTYTSTLNGKNYWSLAMLPLTASSVSTVAQEYKKYAYVFPVQTTVNWQYNSQTSTVRTDFTIDTEVKEGVESNLLIGLLPHQWANLATDSPLPDQYSYSSVRGEIKTMAGNHFRVENIFRGILPTLPYVNNYSEGFSVSALDEKIKQLENDGLSAWTDSYNEGQMMNRLIQTARIADEMGNLESRDKIISTIKERLENWLTAKPGEVAFLFYYNSTWSTMIGYPAGHGQDNNINDHHFHWGYFIHAASFLEQYVPGWANEWGEMINLLVRDAASPDRNDSKFPFLRNFNPYSGHCWANGFATFPQGNDQESTSESMQFNSALIHWGTITGNDEIRDLGIYLYTTEQTAVEEYWFDMDERNFKATQPYSLVSRVWGNSYDNGTFWTSDIAASYGIELYPMHGGSLYLGHNTAYADKLWKEIESNTGILNNQANDNLWHDIMWQFAAFTDPTKAISLYDSYPNRNLKFGVSDAQTYYWLHAMNALGNVDASLTADYPIAAVFNADGNKTYVAHNYTPSPLTVTYSDGFQLEVAPHSMATNKDVAVQSTLTSSFSNAYANGSIELILNVTEGNASKIIFYNGNQLLNEMAESPFTYRVENLQPGIHNFYAKVFDDDKIGVSNIVTVVVGNQLPFNGTAAAIPGTIEAGNYDIFEGGRGQGIAYSDMSQQNEGNYRKNESVDAALVTGEGATVGWVNSGEWLEYTIHVETPGLYSVTFRYASGNNNGGGPFYFLLDGERVSEDITVATTGGWDKWASKTITSIPLKSGVNVLRVAFKNGEFNLGKMTFVNTAPLPYSQPIANAGNNIVVVVPQTTTTLDASTSTDPQNGTLTYTWQQIYGPSVLSFSSTNVVSPEISGLDQEGIYLVSLHVSNGTYSDTDEVLVIVSSTSQLFPIVSINSPITNSAFTVGKAVTISAAASDLDGTISSVEFFANGSSIGTSQTEPYSINWVFNQVGQYVITAKATDNSGIETISSEIVLVIESAPPCDGVSSNGDFRYVFSDAPSNPTITFIPSVAGVGSPTCILYYSTSASGPFPGYGVTPNVAKGITAAEGSTIYFYYTYSYPGQGEKNTANNLLSFMVGNCQAAPSLQVAPQIFSIAEHSPAGTPVGTVGVTYTGSATLNFEITQGNENSIFSIHPTTGEVSVADALLLDFEATPSFSLTVRVTDGTLVASTVHTINLLDIADVTGIDHDFIDAKIYPNPVKNLLTIDWPFFSSAVLHDLSGKRILSTSDSVLDMSSLSRGLYILTIKDIYLVTHRIKVIKE